MLLYCSAVRLPAAAISVLVVVVAVVVGVTSACASFGAAGEDPSAADAGGDAPGPDGGACAAPTCAEAGVSCRAFDFAGPDCPADCDFGGDLANPSVIHECTTGKLHIAADGTLDIVATLPASQTPSVAYRVRVGARVGIKLWDGASLLRLFVADKAAFVLEATRQPSGAYALTLCDGAGTNCQPRPPTVAPDEEHLVVVDVTPSGITASLDCAPFATLPAVALPLKSTLDLVFGRPGAEPAFDGTLDDVTLAYFPP